MMLQPATGYLSLAYTQKTEGNRWLSAVLTPLKSCPHNEVPGRDSHTSPCKNHELSFFSVNWALKVLKGGFHYLWASHFHYPKLRCCFGMQILFARKQKAYFQKCWSMMPNTEPWIKAVKQTKTWCKRHLIMTNLLPEISVVPHSLTLLLK